MCNVMQTMLTTGITLLVFATGVAAGLPDPTRPADYDVEPKVVYEEELPKELVNFSVTGIRITDTDRSAILNGKLVREGDVVGPAKVLEIKPVSVTLDYDQNRVVVRLFSSNLVNKKVRN